MEKGIMCISLDTELLWGMHDVKTVDSYLENIINGRKHAIPAMLTLFEKYDMHVSWAVVGGVMCRNKEEFIANAPTEVLCPSYDNHLLSAYRLLPEMGVNEEKDYLFFGKDILGQISKHRNQFVGTHTFSHYYCTESGQTEQQFEADILAAKKIANTRGIDLKSIIFPRNQVNGNYLEICAANDISIYRGIEENWIYSLKPSLIQRLLRFADCYFPLTGSNTFIPRIENGVINIRGSRILHPYNRKLSILEGLKLRRIKGQMRQAARKGEVFHLWWHPHNFGADLTSNLLFLEKILQYYKKLEYKYGFLSLSMEEIGELYGKKKI